MERTVTVEDGTGGTVAKNSDGPEPVNEGIAFRLEHDETTGALSVGGRIVGEVAGNTIILNAGWCRLAGVGLRVDGDPQGDSRRTVFKRPVNDHRLASQA